MIYHYIPGAPAMPLYLTCTKNKVRQSSKELNIEKMQKILFFKKKYFF